MTNPEVNLGGPRTWAGLSPNSTWHWHDTTTVTRHTTSWLMSSPEWSGTRASLKLSMMHF